MAMETDYHEITFQNYIATFNPTDPKNFPKWVFAGSIKDITEFFYNQLNLTDDFSLDLLRSLIEICRRQNSVSHSFKSFSKVIAQKAAGMAESKLRSHLHDFLFHLHKKGFCLLNKSGDHIEHFVLIKEAAQSLENKVSAHGQANQKINERYIDLINKDPQDFSFPVVGEFEIAKILKESEMEFFADKYGPETIREISAGSQQIILIRFPNNTTIYCITKFFGELHKIALRKIKAYLDESKPGNAYAVTLKNLNASLKFNSKPEMTTNYFNELLISYDFKNPLSKEYLDWTRIGTIVFSLTRANRKYADLYHSSFLFTSFLKNTIHEHKEKASRQEDEHKIKKEKEKDFALIEELAKNEITPFNPSVIAQMKDPNEDKPLKEKYPGDKFHDFIKDLVDYLLNHKDKTELMSFAHEFDKFFIHRRNLLTYLINFIQIIPQKFLAEHRFSWSQDILNNNYRNDPLYSDDAYLNYLTDYINTQFPYLVPLLEHTEDIYLAFKQASKNHQSEVKRWYFDDAFKNRKPLNYLVNLPRDFVFSDAMHHLSFIYWFAFIRNLRAFFLGIKTKKPVPKNAQKKTNSSINDNKPQFLPEEKKTGSAKPAENLNSAKKTVDEDDAAERRMEAQKKAQEKLKQAKEKATNLKDQITGGSDPEVMIKKVEAVWNRSLEKKAAHDTRKNVEDAIQSYVSRTLHGKIPMDYSFFQKIITELTKDKHFINIHKQDNDKMQALAKYIELFIYLKYVKPKYKV